MLTPRLVLMCTVALAVAIAADACFIQGQDSGECQEPEEFKADMEFCSVVVTYRACVPKENPLWPKHDVFNKDKWVAETYKQIVDERIRHETNETLQDDGINELGEEGEVEVRFFDNPDCQEAFRNYFCWLNFPRCDDEDESLILCRSTCENLMEACEYSEDLHRCYHPEYYGGHEPEVDDILDDEGNPIYWRAHWPGQPFRDNEFVGDEDPVVVCTPSIKNAASPPLAAAGAAAVALSAAAAVVAAWRAM